ncbi:synaptonemal complex protein 1 [Lingula anatina]|uniref:Synaptonemal complex protein 1 n=1 Tax=Lingula anatina TaxID=7574 RepID=A0A1S3K5P2_LINAN|nr:synaptonemal complex protein 1 [Lingula anatina]|eukprot:XP_013417749.1 synaptonemal complex protein 1 [Lingula anatina]
MAREGNSSKLIQSLENQLESSSSENSEQAGHISVLKREKQSLEKELTSCKKEIANLKKDLEKNARKATGIENDLLKTIEENKEIWSMNETLKKAVEEKNEEIMKIKDETAKMSDEFESALDNRSKESSDLESRLKSSRDDLVKKNKHIKELEKEIKNLKSKLTTQTKLNSTFEGEIAKKNEAIKTTEEEKVLLKADLENVQKEMLWMKEGFENMKQECEELKKTTNDAIKDKKVAQMDFDRQLKEMMGTLEKYQKDNEKIITKKDKEIGQLKQKMQKQQDTKKQEQLDLKEINKALEDTRKQLDAVEEEKQKFMKAAEEQTIEIKCLADNVREKKTEIQTLQTTIKDLQQELEKLKEPSLIEVMDASIPVVPQTPKVPKIVDSVTNMAKTPKPTVTPRKGIQIVPATLTPKKSSVKPGSGGSKRKVIFASEEDDRGSSSDSSTSELMELEVIYKYTYFGCDHEIDKEIAQQEALPGVQILDNPITISEVKNAIKKLKNGKAPGEDVISNEMLKTGGHLRRDQTLDKLQRRYYWRNMVEDVRTFIACCAICQMATHKNKQSDPPLQPIPVTTPEAWNMIGIDLIGPLKETTNNNLYICTVACYYSKMAHVRSLQSKEATGVANFLLDLFLVDPILPSDINRQDDEQHVEPTEEDYEDITERVTRVRSSVGNEDIKNIQKAQDRQKKNYDARLKTQKGLRVKLDTAMSVITATAVLHNIAIDLKEQDFGEEEEEQENLINLNDDDDVMGTAVRQTIVEQYFQ